MNKQEKFEELHKKSRQKEKVASFANRYEAGRDNVTESFIRSASVTGKIDTVERVQGIVGNGAEATSEVSHAIALSTGILSLDYATGGGFPAGVVDIHGEPSSGKSSVAFAILAAAQKQGKTCALVTTEYYDPMRAMKAGVSQKELLLITGTDAESANASVLSLLRKFDNVVVVIDSMGMLRPQVDTPGKWIGMVAQFVEEASAAADHGSVVIMLNQVRRKKVGSSEGMWTWFSKNHESMAKRVLDGLSFRAELTRHSVTENGFELAIKVEMSHVRKPHSIVIVPFNKKRGVNIVQDTLHVAVELGVVELRGHYFYFKSELLGQGVDNVVSALGEGVLYDAIHEETQKLLVG